MALENSGAAPAGAGAAIDAEALTAFTQALVRARSVYEPELGNGEQAAAAVVAARMREFGWEPRIDEVAPGRPNVVTVLDGGAGPTLMFEGHTDVVTEGDPAAWAHDPFGAEIVEGKLYGRGSADMKGGVAAMLYAADAVARSSDFRGRIVVGALADEEGMMLGAKHFVASGAAAGIDAAVICEPEGFEVCVDQKGAIRVRVDATGVMAHGAMPEHGLNPISALTEFMRLMAELQSAIQEEAGVHPRTGSPYITPTVVRGGAPAQINVIPAHAWLALDIRTVPGVDHADLLHRVRNAAQRVALETQAKIEVEVIDDRPPTSIEPGADIVRSVLAAHRGVAGADAALGGVPGTTDGTILWRDAGIPIVTYGPGGKWIAHQVDEHVEVAELDFYARVYRDAALRFLNRDFD